MIITEQTIKATNKNTENGENNTEVMPASTPIKKAVEYPLEKFIPLLVAFSIFLSYENSNKEKVLLCDSKVARSFLTGINKRETKNIMTGIQLRVSRKNAVFDSVIKNLSEKETILNTKRKTATADRGQDKKPRYKYSKKRET